MELNPSYILVGRAAAETLARALMRAEFFFASDADPVGTVARPPLFEEARSALADGVMESIFGDIATALLAWYDPEQEADGLTLRPRVSVAPTARRVLERNARAYAGHRLAAELLAPSSPRASARQMAEADRRMDNLVAACVAV